MNKESKLDRRRKRTKRRRRGRSRRRRRRRRRRRNIGYKSRNSILVELDSIPFSPLLLLLLLLSWFSLLEEAPHNINLRNKETFKNIPSNANFPFGPEISDTVAVLSMGD
jgi:hypothetical protein